MKYLKILGLAAVAAMAFMAFAAGTASATKLYSAGTALGVGTTIHAVSTGAAILETTGESPSILDECKSSTIHGTVTNAGGTGATVSGDVTTLSWNECTKTTHNKSLGGANALEIHHLSGTTNGTLTVNGIEVEVTSFEGFSPCVYTASDIGTLIGGGPATININTVVTKTGGPFICPSNARWTAVYEVTSPNPLVVHAS
jgi:hypothetical protein